MDPTRSFPSTGPMRDNTDPPRKRGCEEIQCLVGNGGRSVPLRDYEINADEWVLATRSAAASVPYSNPTAFSHLQGPFVLVKQSETSTGELFREEDPSCSRSDSEGFLPSLCWWRVSLSSV